LRPVWLVAKVLPVDTSLIAADANKQRSMKCTEGGSIGWVDPRPNWSEVVSFVKGIR
jgi:hypothetical protein